MTQNRNQGLIEIHQGSFVSPEALDTLYLASMAVRRLYDAGETSAELVAIHGSLENLNPMDDRQSYRPHVRVHRDHSSSKMHDSGGGSIASLHGEKEFSFRVNGSAEVALVTRGFGPGIWYKVEDIDRTYTRTKERPNPSSWRSTRGGQNRASSHP